MSAGSPESTAKLRETLEDLPGLVRSLPPDQVNQPPGEGAWSAREVMVHLADAEIGLGFRIRLILTEERPHLAPFDADRFAARFKGLETTAQALERWSADRRADLAIVESLTEEEWERAGVHPEHGDISVRQIVELMAGHDGSHLAQMRAAAGVT